jgi:two-component system NtrC family sensor kinase
MDGTASSVFIYIQDTGCGIPKESKEEIFSPYFTGKKHGTGHGLSVVNTIPEKHRGKIEVESEVGGGTTFTVTLPITK